jgi:predicted nucleic acid-binding protein
VKGDPRLTAVMDTSVLINLAILDRIGLVGASPRLRFVIPGEVLAEVKRPRQRSRVGRALEGGLLEEVALDEPEALARFADLRKRMKIGEAACLALAITKGWLFVCDERRVVLREATKHLGKNRLLNTPGLFLLGIRAGYWTVDEADEAKAVLEAHRYRMKFSSFRELLH